MHTEQTVMTLDVTSRARPTRTPGCENDPNARCQYGGFNVISVYDIDALIATATACTNLNTLG